MYSMAERLYKLVQENVLHGRTTLQIGSRECTPCPAGTYGNSQGECIRCLLSKECIRCLLSKVSKPGSTYCDSCPGLQDILSMFWIVELVNHVHLIHSILFFILIYRLPMAKEVAVIVHLVLVMLNNALLE